MPPGKAPILCLHALRIEQRLDIPLFVFGVDGRMVHRFATVDAAHRSADGVLGGYQRTRVERHIAEIYAYLATDSAILPNAIVVAFSSDVTFEARPGVMRTEWGTPGTLHVPLPGGGEARPGLIVDGQQRTSALARLPATRNFPVVVVGFLATSADLQREQFVLVNKTKPLPRDLQNELLPHIGAELPKPLQMRRVAATVIEKLRYARRSPFYGRIRGLGANAEGCNVSQAAVLAVVETSIRRGGTLSPYYSPDPTAADVTAMAQILEVYFVAVARVWPYAWNESPWTSRLVHGVGITALGRLMDVLIPEVNVTSPRAVGAVERRLRKIESRCAWTSGRWPHPLSCPWDALQNTSQDKRRLADFLIAQYEQRR
ncbi:MAG TPA: DGQHR domain-containing protein DpdB [Solirubrobacteraceae bacterium]|jgi:DGQHR domain-containing protein|nr:DGQHR domain-containing protein DpdB [Solirubrobacteraceae bacterium]